MTSMLDTMKELDALLDNKLHHIEDITGRPVYFYLASAADHAKYQPDIDKGNFSIAAMRCAVTRARDSEGRLVFKNSKEQNAILQETKQAEYLKDVGAKIINYENEIFKSESLYDLAKKN